MRKCIAGLVLPALFVVPGFAQQKRVAILDFDYSTVQSGVSAIFGTNQDVGKGVADLLVENLVKDGTYRVIERKAIDKIIAEQNLSNSDRTDPSTAAKLGRLLGADAIVLGSIVQFGATTSSPAWEAGLRRRLDRYGLGGVGRKNAKAVVGLTARIVSVNTGEILAVGHGNGESKRSGTTLLGGGGGAGAAVDGLMDMTSSNFAGTVLGEAVHEAVASLGKELAASASHLPTTAVTVDALVADVSGNTIVINAGSRGGIKPGDKLQVKRVGREIRDPATGKVIRRMEEPLGELTITEVDESSAVGKYSGTGAPQVGDAVKSR